LPELTWLERLEAWPAEELQLEEALPNLRALTCLFLTYPGLRIPTSLTAPPRLMRLCLFSLELGAEESLPAGAGLAALRWLALPWTVLRSAAAAGVLSGAQRLEYLCCISAPALQPDSEEQGGQPQGEAAEVHRQQWEAFWRFLATHPPLRCFAVLDHPDTSDVSRVSRELLGACFALGRCRPGLQLRLLQDWECIRDEMLHSEEIPQRPTPYPFF